MSPILFVIILAVTALLYCPVISASGCERFLSSANDNSTRFLDPPINRLIPLADTRKMFKSLNAKQCSFGPAIFERVLRTPSYLVDHFPYSRVAVTIRLFSACELWRSGARIHKFDSRHEVLGSENQPTMEIRLGDAAEVQLSCLEDIRVCGLSKDLISLKSYGPIREREFAEQFIRRRSLYELMRKTAAKFRESKIMSDNRISAWMSGANTAGLNFDLDGLTHAEFAALLNDVAIYLDERSRR